VVVAPAAGTLFIGAAYEEAYPLPAGGIGFRRVAQMALTFDHRIANGAGAARFLAAIRDRVAALRDEP
jgi:pyruvate/2-oxoglutarate dehydrogenase complex dihydrolipoamide acyltransferase (E2) component